MALLLVIVAACMCCKAYREKLNDKVYAIPPQIVIEDTSRQTYENTGRFALNHINQKKHQDDANHFFYPSPDVNKHMRRDSSNSYGHDGTSTVDVSSHLGVTTDATHQHSSHNTYGNNRVAPLQVKKQTAVFDRSTFAPNAYFSGLDAGEEKPPNPFVEKKSWE